MQAQKWRIIMKKDLLHTPEGVRDIYSTECVEKKIIENRLHDVCKLYGYNDIQTPSIESVSYTHLRAHET